MLRITLQMTATCTTADTIVLVRPPEAADNAITRVIRLTTACDILPTAKRSHRIMCVTVHYMVYTYIHTYAHDYVHIQTVICTYLQYSQLNQH